MTPEMKAHIDDCCRAVYCDETGKYEIHLPEKIREPLFGYDTFYIYNGIPFEIISNPAIMDFRGSDGLWTTDLYIVDRTALPVYVSEQLGL